MIRGLVDHQEADTKRTLPFAAVEAGRRNLTLGQLANIANAMRLGVHVSFVRPDGTPMSFKTDAPVRD
jgi:hypothetical protein